MRERGHRRVGGSGGRPLGADLLRGPQAGAVLLDGRGRRGCRRSGRRGRGPRRGRERDGGSLVTGDDDYLVERESRARFEKMTAGVTDDMSREVIDASCTST